MKLSDLDPNSLKVISPGMDVQTQALPKPQASTPPAQGTPAKLSDLDPNTVNVVSPGLEQQPSGGFIHDYVAPVGRFVDRYTGAPTRKALGAAIDKQNPLTAFYDQFGADPEKAPTGKELAQKLGFDETKASDVMPSLYTKQGNDVVRGLLKSNHVTGLIAPFVHFEKDGLLDPTASGAAGLGLDVAADWTNAIPGALAAKGLFKEAAPVVKGVGKGLVEGGVKAADLATGTRAASKTLETASEVTNSIKNQIDQIVKPVQSSDWATHLKTAARNNINPENLPAAVEFGKESIPARMQRHVRETPVGGDIMDKYVEGLNQVNTAIDHHVGGLSGGRTLDHIDAGNLLVDSWKKAESKLHDGLDLTYSSVQKYAPGLYLNKKSAEPYLSALNGAERQAVGLVRRGFGPQKEAGNHLLEVVNQLRQAKNFKQNVESLRNLGGIAFKDAYSAVGKVPPDQGKLQELYFKLRDALIDTVHKDINPEFATELRKNNELMTQFMRDKSQVYSAIGDKNMAPEKVYQRLIKNSDSNKLEALKANLDPNAFKQLRGTYLNDLIARNADGQVLYPQTVRNLKRNATQLKVMFEPQELQNMTDLLNLGNSFGPAVLSHSGTGGSIAFKEMFTQAPKQNLVKKGLNYVIDRARGAATPLEEAATPAQGLVEAKPKGLIDRAAENTVTAIKTKRGPIENRFKGAQSVTPQSYRRDQRK